MGDVHVDRSHRPDLVRIRLGNPTVGDRFLVDLSLSTARLAPVPEVQAAGSGDLAFSLARFSYHDWRRSDQIAWRLLLARFGVPLLSLRDATNSQPSQPVPAFFAALAAEIGDGVEPLRRTGRAMVLVWTASRAPYRRRAAGELSDFPDYQRQSFISELSNDHSVPRLLRRYFPSTFFTAHSG